MFNLYEYQNKIAIKDEFDGLETFLDDIWAKREKNSFFDSEVQNIKLSSAIFAIYSQIK